MTTHRSPWKPRFNPWLIALTVTLATFMEVLDTSIANVSLPHIAGNLSASQDESAWVLTSYLVSNAIILPISAWLSTIIGRKRFYMTCVALFTCQQLPVRACAEPGRADFLPGSAGRRRRRPAAQRAGDPRRHVSRRPSAAWHLLCTAWRWWWRPPSARRSAGGSRTTTTGAGFSTSTCPIGILSLFLTNRLVEDPPFLKREQERRRGIRADYVGLGLITIWRLPACKLRSTRDRRRTGFPRAGLPPGRPGGLRIRCLDRLGVASPESRRGHPAVSEAQFCDGDVFQLHPGNRAVRHDVHDPAIFAGALGLSGGEGRRGAGGRRIRHDYA